MRFFVRSQIGTMIYGDFIEADKIITGVNGEIKLQDKFDICIASFPKGSAVFHLPKEKSETTS